MSTIKSQTEHLTLNADGTGKEIKFQANGVEKVAITSDGNVLVTDGNVTVNTETKNFITKIPYFSGGDGSSYSSTYSASQSESNSLQVEGAYKIIGQVSARAYANSICIKTNLTANNIMFMFKAWGYLYNHGVAESYKGGYTYQSDVIVKSGYKAGVAQADIQDVYRATDGSLCLRVYLGHTGYTEGKLNIALHSHGSAYHGAKIVAVQIHNANTNYSF